MLEKQNTPAATKTKTINMIVPLNLGYEWSVLFSSFNCHDDFDLQEGVAFITSVSQTFSYWYFCPLESLSLNGYTD